MKIFYQIKNVKNTDAFFEILLCGDWGQNYRFTTSYIRVIIVFFLVLEYKSTESHFFKRTPSRILEKRSSVSVFPGLFRNPVHWTELFRQPAASQTNEKALIKKTLLLHAVTL